MWLLLLLPWLLTAERFLIKRENKSDGKINNLKCVINARPLLLEKCISGTDGMSMCYTVEFDDTGTILYGCTVVSQQRMSKDSIDCQNNVFKKCPRTLDKSRFFDRQHLQYCCCNTTKCNGNYLHKREAKMSTKRIDVNRSDIAVPELKRALLDINKPQSMNSGVSLKADKISRISWSFISGIVCAIVVLACIVAAAVIFINKRLEKRRAVLKANVGEMVTLRTNIDDAENNDDLPGMICTPGRKSSTNVIHSDLTDTIVSAQLTPVEQNALIHTVKQNGQLKTVIKGKKPPKITRVITYATSDEITNIDLSSSDDNTSSKDLNEDLLLKLIRNGPKQFPFKFEEIREILLQGAKVFLEEPTLLEVPLPCVVYGDMHGQYSDLHRWFNLNGWPSQVRSVFLGDFVDRGSHGIEVVMLLTALKIRFPNNIFLCRGNHEEESLNRAYSFYEEVCIRFSDNLAGRNGRALYPYFRILFNNLPLAVLIGGRILGMHGGIGPRLTSLQAIREIRRPLEEFEIGSLECDLVWSDPDTSPDCTGFRSNFEREPLYGIGQLFAPDTVQNLCKKLGIDMLIRGHQAPLHGYALFSDGCMLTLFSAPGYKGSSNGNINMGASLEISTSMNITIKQIQVTEKFRQKRIVDAEQMKAKASKEFLQSPVKSNQSISQSTSSIFDR
uniref:protein-serine/threonine phosphatase n=1 Tax=Onchocerca volvulus TaxID=6282 RepID=A0A8R1TJF2_ONCVO